VLSKGINQYSDEPNIEFAMSKYFTKSAVIGAIENIFYKKGNTHIGKAINFTREISLVPKSGARDGVKKVKTLKLAL